MSRETAAQSDGSEEERAPDAAARESAAGPDRGSRSRLEYLANILTVLVALAAIGLSIWQGYENRRFYRLSVLPHLEPSEASWSSPAPIDNEYFLLPGRTDSLYAVSYSLTNSGLGPAVLKDLRVYREGELVFDAGDSGGKYALSDVKADLDRLPFPTLDLNQGYAAGEMLEAGEVHHLITVGVPFAAVDADALESSPPTIIMDRVLERYSFVFCYCSVYGTDCDATYLGSAPPAEHACRF